MQRSAFDFAHVDPELVEGSLGMAAGAADLL
jgi:hypothetical protein